MSQSRFHPKLNKKRIFTHPECTVYSVNGLAMRNVAQPDEEFGNFATHEEFPHVIPKGELWVSEKTVGEEGLFFIADVLARLHAKANGAAPATAYEIGLKVERCLREKILGTHYRGGRPHKRVPPELYLGHYLTLPDKRSQVAVWMVDGNLVRSLYKTDYTEGGHGYVYRWVPKSEIWIEEAVDRREIPYIVAHEYLERQLMRDQKLDYAKAHAICSEVEFSLRKEGTIGLLLTRGRRRFEKADLPRLANSEFFAYVVKHYVKR